MEVWFRWFSMIFLFSWGDFWGSMFSFRGVIDLEGVYHIPKRTMKMWIQHLCSFWTMRFFCFFLIICVSGESLLLEKLWCFFWGSCGHVVFACCCFLWWCFRFEVGVSGESNVSGLSLDDSYFFSQHPNQKTTTGTSWVWVLFSDSGTVVGKKYAFSPVLSPHFGTKFQCELVDTDDPGAPWHGIQRNT